MSEGALREALAIAVAVSGGRVRAQAREALTGVLNPLPAGSATGCCSTSANDGTPSENSQPPAGGGTGCCHG
jgi:hypothetical protein